MFFPLDNNAECGIINNNNVVIFKIGDVVVTIKDIAGEAGVSYSTVSVALGNRRTALPLSPKTREKVLAAARKLGYRRNALAGQIRTGRTRSLAFVTPNLEAEYVTRILLGVMEGADKLGYSVKVCRVTRDSARESYDRILETRQDAIVAVGDIPDADYLIDSARPLGIAVGCADCKGDPNYNVRIYSDDRQGEADAVEHLFRLGCRNFAFVSDDPADRRYVLPRLAGFREALARHGLETPEAWIVNGRDRIPGFLRSCRDTGALPDAVCCSSDFIAARVILAAMELGFRVPADFSVIGFGDLDFTREIAPGISSVSQNYREIGARTAELLIGRIGSPLLPAVTGFVATTVIERESTRRNSN